MDIAVLIKRVPDTASVLQTGDDGKSIQEKELQWVMNPYDEIAVEQALQLKENFGGSITIISVGPEQTEEIIRTALAMGADKGIRIEDSRICTSDSLTTAKVLAAALRQNHADLIFCGFRGVDHDHCQTGPAVAELMNLPHLSRVINMQLKDNILICHQMMEQGILETVSSLPALVTVQRGLNKPRYASLSGILRAKKKPLCIKTLHDLKLSAEDIKPRTRISSLTINSRHRKRKIIEGRTFAEKVSNLAAVLNQERDLS